MDCCKVKKLIQVIPVTGYMMVHRRDIDDSSHGLEVTKVDFLGLFEGGDEERNIIEPLELSNGEFCSAAEDSNYCGMIKEGESINHFNLPIDILLVE